jgi:hypothetical protein
MIEKFTYQWVPTSIKHFVPLYKGRRYWIFLNDKEYPFQDWTKDSDIIVYDIDCSGVLAVGSYKENGSINCSYLGGQGVVFEASSPKDMLHQSLEIAKSYC